MPDLAYYKGRWIAMGEDGSVAAVGESREEARQFGVQARPRSRLVLAWVSPHPPHVMLPEWPLTTVWNLQSDAQIWLAGGPVRDLLLERSPADWDFVTDGSGLNLARAVANALDGAYYPLDTERATGRAIVHRPGSTTPITLDFARLRGATIEADLWERDFTINAMALTRDGQLIDPTGGRFDLEVQLLRMARPSAFEDDPARLLRAVRLATQFGFTLESETAARLRSQSPLIQDVAAERVRQEMVKLLADRRADIGLAQMAQFDLLSLVLPELPAHDTGSESTLALVNTLHELDQVIRGEPERRSSREAMHPRGAPPPWAWEALSQALAQHQRALLGYLTEPVSAEVTRSDLLKWSALFCPLAPGEQATPPWQRAASQLEALRFSGNSIDFISTLLRSHPHIAKLLTPPRGAASGATLSDREIYRFFRTAGDTGVAVALLALGQVLVMRGSGLDRHKWLRQLKTVVTLLEAYFARHEVVVAPPRLLTGWELLQLGLPQGPAIGEALETLREAQAAGEITDRAEAMAYVERHLPMWHTPKDVSSTSHEAS
jgi:hypothetical protein